MSEHPLAAPASPPPDLPADPACFWAAGAALADPPCSPPPGEAGLLERLGPPPFPKSGFPLIGFLASVYDHVATQCAARPRETPVDRGSAARAPDSVP